jgi:hypothetical protein
MKGKGGASRRSLGRGGDGWDSREAEAGWKEIQDPRRSDKGGGGIEALMAG